MSESEILDQSSSSPQTTYLADYQPPGFFVDEVALDVNLTENDAIITSEMRIRRNRHTNKAKELILNGEELELIDISIDGKKINEDAYSTVNDKLIIHQPADLFTLKITNRIYPQNNTALSGLYRSRDTYCTQCEAEGFRRITYYPDRPDILSKFTTTIHADKTKYPMLLSNGNLVDSGDEEGGRHWAKWEDPFKKPSYLFALVAGDFDLLEGQHTTQSNRDIELKVYVEKGMGDQSAHALYSLQEAMKWDEITYGREYDLDVYMIVAISDFNMGAMENKGLNIFNTKYVLAKPETATDLDYIYILSVVGHEYFHNWSGNRVTCRDWFQLSLKEGFTIFRDQSFTEDLLSHGVMRIHDVNALRESQFPEDAGPLAHPVRPDSYIEINNFYTATVYNKGAEVLRMLQTIVGRKNFRKAMDLYFSTYDGQAVTIEDYVKNIENVSGLDLEQFRLWYSQSGTPEVTVKDDYDADKKTYTLTVSQFTPKTPDQSEKHPLHIPIRLGLLNDVGHDMELHIEGQSVETEKVLHLTKQSQQFQFTNVNAKPVPSLLRGFSAPVKLSYNYTVAQLLFLFEYDKDEFNRWEAGQTVALRTILSLVDDYRRDITLAIPEEWVQTIKRVLTKSHDDLYLLAEMLRIPSENYISEQMDVVDVEAIHAVREFVIKCLATALEAEFKDIYQKYNTDNGKYLFNMHDIGARQLKNRALSYLSCLSGGDELAKQQFDANLRGNMTDTSAALACLSNSSLPLRQQALQEFYEVWKDDALVVDKWLSIQAKSSLPNTLAEVKQLTRHEAFDIKNPNKVYSLIGAFGAHNPSSFHAENGEGYVFLREILLELDKLNPQVAARMVKPLTTWKRYDKERQRLMCEQLEVILQAGQLSPDMYEIVSKSLKERF